MGGFEVKHDEGTLLQKAQKEGLANFLAFYDEVKLNMPENVWLLFNDNQAGSFKTSILFKIKLIRGKVFTKYPLKSSQDTPLSVQDFQITSHAFIKLYSFLKSGMSPGVNTKEDLVRPCQRH